MTGMIGVAFHGRKRTIQSYVSATDITWQQTGKVKLWNHDGTPMKRKLSPEIRKTMTTKPPSWHVEIDPARITEFGAPFLRNKWKVRGREAREKLAPEFIATLWP